MLTPELISQWLYGLQSITDTATLQFAVQQYPYFLPSRYMLATTDNVLPAITAVNYAPNHLLFYNKMGDTRKVSASTISSLQPAAEKDEASLIQPVFTEDYFLHQGLHTEDVLPALEVLTPEPEDPKSLMVMMSFTDWLMHFRTKTEQEAEEADSRRAVRNMWQKEKLAAAMEDDGQDDEIPEEVFKMAVDSIAKEDGLVSESLAEILVKQQKWSKAIEMYRKLSLKNPAKSVYFAAQIESLQKQNTEHL